MRKAPAISSPSHSRDCPGGSPKSPGRRTDSRLQLLPAMMGKGIGRTVSEAYWAEDRHTPSASDSERVCRAAGMTQRLVVSTTPNCNLILKYKILLQRKNGGEKGIRTLGSFESLVFKTSSLNRSDTSPYQVTQTMITFLRRNVN